jgi:hypothetical protein
MPVVRTRDDWDAFRKRVESLTDKIKHELDDGLSERVERDVYTLATFALDLDERLQALERLIHE